MAAGNPTFPMIDGDTALAIQDTISEFTGAKHTPHGVKKYHIPAVGTYQTGWEYLLSLLLGGMAIGGKVIPVATPLYIGVFACHYRIGATSYAFAGETGLALDANETHYVYLDTDETLKTNTTGFPADCVRLAVVTTDGSGITNIDDVRMENADQGGTNDWANVAATADVDMAGYEINDLAGMDLDDWTELTISSGAITPTGNMNCTVDTEGDAASDTLNTITPTAGKLQFLLLRAEDAARVVTIVDGGDNVTLLDGNYTLDDADKMILLMQVDDANWVEISRNRNTLVTLTSHLDCNSKHVTGVGLFGFPDATASPLTISGGTLICTGSDHTVKSETGYTDDVDTIEGVTADKILIIRPYSALYTITVKHDTGNLLLANGRNFIMDGADNAMIGFLSTSIGMQELFRNPISINDLINTARSIPYPLSFSITGALIAGVQEEWLFHCPEELVIINATGRVHGAPSGGSCIVDIQDDGASIFAFEGEMICIADGTYQATSTTKNAVVAAGSILRCEVKSSGSSPNGATYLTVSIRAQIAPKAAP